MLEIELFVRKNVRKSKKTADLEKGRRKNKKMPLSFQMPEFSSFDTVIHNIIESVFGKYKNFSGKSPMKEIGKSILTIPVFTSNINYNEVKNAMERISAQDVIDWQRKNIGTSLLARRKMAFDNARAKNQVKKI